MAVKLAVEMAVELAAKLVAGKVAWSESKLVVSSVAKSVFEWIAIK